MELPREILHKRGKIPRAQPDDLLPLGILRMSLAGKHELNRALSIRQDVDEPSWIVQAKVQAFVRS